jgi:muconolactone delta-isomerase
MGKYNYTMENLTDDLNNKYQVTIHFEMDEDFMSLVPSHRVYISSLIEKGNIDYYSVSMETQRCWIIFNALNKKEVQKLLENSPLHKYWTMEIDELFVYDAQSYRLPALQLN